MDYESRIIYTSDLFSKYRDFLYANKSFGDGSKIDANSIAVAAAILAAAHTVTNIISKAGGCA